MDRTGPDRDRNASATAQGAPNRDEHDATLVGDGPEQVAEQPTHIGAYRLEDRVGTGAMGAVYRARDDRLGRTVAVKLLVRAGAQHRLRVVREARALARLSVPNVVQVFEAGEHDGRPYVVMEFVDGRPLDIWLAARPRSASEILDVFRQAGRGLADAHAHGLVHRDFKPANVLVGRDGRVRVVDFGLAQSQVTSSDTSSSSIPEAEHTVEGLAGTPAYLAPERFALQPATPASDQFAFAVALYEALWAQHPFGDRADGMPGLAARIADGRPRPPPSSRKVPERVRAAVMRALARRPVDRWRTMDALLAELAPARRRIAPVVLGVLGIGFAVALAWPDGASNRCIDAADRLQTLWNDRREDVRAALANADAQRGQQTWNAIDPRMAEYARAWADAHREACAGEDPQQLDASMACLGARRDAFEALVRLTSEADREVARGAFASALALEPAAPCLSAVTHDADDAALPPDVRARVRELRAQLAEVDMLVTLGKLADAEALAGLIRNEADAIGHEALRIEAGFMWAHCRLSRGAHAEAEPELRAAFHAAEATEHDDVAAKAALQLAWLYGEQLGQAEEAHVWLRHAESALARRENPRSRLKLIVFRLAVARNARAPVADVEAEVERALALLDRMPDMNPLAVAETLNNLGAVLHHVQRPAEARRLYERARAQIEELEVEPPVLGDVLHNLASSQRELDGARVALPTSEAAVAVLERTVGPDHPSVVVASRQLASLRLATGDPQGALDVLERVEGVMTAQGQRDDVAVALVWVEEGMIAPYLGEFERSVELFTKAHTVLMAQLGPDDRRVVGVGVMRGLALRRMGRLEAAREVLRDVLPRQEALSVERDNDLAQLQAVLAWTELSLGDRALALTRARQASEPCRLPCTDANDLGRAAWAVLAWQDGGDPTEILQRPFGLPTAVTELQPDERALLERMLATIQ